MVILRERYLAEVVQCKPGRTGIQILRSYYYSILLIQKVDKTYEVSDLRVKSTVLTRVCKSLHDLASSPMSSGIFVVSLSALLPLWPSVISQNLFSSHYLQDFALMFFACSFTVTPSHPSGLVSKSFSQGKDFYPAQVEPLCYLFHSIFLPSPYLSQSVIILIIE